MFGNLFFSRIRSKREKRKSCYLFLIMLRRRIRLNRYLPQKVFFLLQVSLFLISWWNNLSICTHTAAMHVQEDPIWPTFFSTFLPGLATDRPKFVILLGWWVRSITNWPAFTPVFSLNPFGIKVFLVDFSWHKLWFEKIFYRNDFIFSIFYQMVLWNSTSVCLSVDNTNFINSNLEDNPKVVSPFDGQK